ncbi:MAG: KTSC domain-containing protein [Pseudomonadota bacterium]
MIRTAVTSSNIKSVGYDAASETLEIEFGNGSVHQYEGVPQDEYEKLMASESVGKYFSASIRSKYKSTKVGSEE